LSLAVSTAEFILHGGQSFNPKLGQNFGATKFCPQLEIAMKRWNILLVNMLQFQISLGMAVDISTMEQRI
jgi:hypothetical protein